MYHSKSTVPATTPLNRNPEMNAQNLEATKALTVKPLRYSTNSDILQNNFLGATSSLETKFNLQRRRMKGTRRKIPENHTLKSHNAKRSVGLWR